MKLIVGLGNPGAAYAMTRHNAGRLGVEFIAASEGLRWRKKNALAASMVCLEWEGVELALAYPETYMNVSGEAVKRLAGFCGADPAKDLLVVVDDAALAFGRLRLRSRGSDGGHNGLASVSESLGGEGYARLRIGIGGPAGDNPEGLKEHVLGVFSAAEKEAFPGILEEVFKACRLWVLKPVSDAMAKVNASRG